MRPMLCPSLGWPWPNNFPKTLDEYASMLHALLHHIEPTVIWLLLSIGVVFVGALIVPNSRARIIITPKRATPNLQEQPHELCPNVVLSSLVAR